jgi:TDG/mug DNA glycosylase family protein
MTGEYPFATLSDLMVEGMDLVFVGINPSVYAVEQGHYFARRSNRFWPAFSRSVLSAPIRKALGVEALRPEHDADLLRFGIGFTDVVKRPSSNASQLKPAEFAAWAPELLARLERHRPRVACFHGLMGFRPFVRYGLGQTEAASSLGPQPLLAGPTRLYVVPNPSPANAHFTPADQTAWYDRLAEYLRD